MQKICLILPSSVSPTVTAERKTDRVVKAIDDLLVEYAMLFLTYIFQPTTIQGYCDILAFCYKFEPRAFWRAFWSVGGKEG